VCSKGILVVEDDADVRVALCELLEDEGYRVRYAEDGRIALEHLVRHEAPCLILLDLMMPNLDGYEFRVHQQKNPTIAHIPVVVATAHGKVTQKARDLGLLEWIRKPFEHAELLAIVEKYCGAGHR
jgi:CheY-like chemotaxis protein